MGGDTHRVALPVPVNSLTSLACLGATHCWGHRFHCGCQWSPNGAAMAGTDDGGARWTGQNVPGTVSYLSAVGCSDIHRCTAVGQGAQSTTTQAAIIDTVDGGHTWAQVATPPGVLEMSAVTCMTDGRCVAVGATAMGDAALIATSTGSAWTQAGALPVGMTGARDVACSNDQDCWVTARSTTAAGAVSGAIALTTDGGASWTALPIPPGTGLLNGIACIVGATTGSGALPGSTTVAGSPGSSTTAPVATTTTAPPTTTTPPLPPVGVPGVRCTAVGRPLPRWSTPARPRSDPHHRQRRSHLGPATGQRVSGIIGRHLLHGHQHLRGCGHLGGHRGRPGSHDSHRVRPQAVVTIVVGVDPPTAERCELRFDLPVRGRRGVSQRVFRYLRRVRSIPGAAGAT